MDKKDVNTEKSASSTDRGKLPKKIKLIAGLSVVAVLGILVVSIFFLINNNRISDKYSEADADRSVQLFYDTELLGEVDVLNSSLNPDGRYSEEIVAKKSVIIRQWRNYERLKYPCREQIMEKYPELEDYSAQKKADKEPYDERGSFTVKENGKEYYHTAVLLRHGGWDYLIDVSVDVNDRDKYSEWTESFLNGLFFLG